MIPNKGSDLSLPCISEYPITHEEFEGEWEPVYEVSRTYFSIKTGRLEDTMSIIDPSGPNSTSEYRFDLTNSSSIESLLERCVIVAVKSEDFDGTSSRDWYPSLLIVDRSLEGARLRREIQNQLERNKFYTQPRPYERSRDRVSEDIDPGEGYDLQCAREMFGDDDGVNWDRNNDALDMDQQDPEFWG